MCSWHSNKLRFIFCPNCTNVVIGQPADCSIFWLRQLQRSSCQVLFLLQWQQAQQTRDVIGLPMRWQAHSQQQDNEMPVHAYTCRQSSPVCRRCTYKLEANEVHAGRAWCDPAFLSLLWHELWHSEQLVASPARRRLYCTVNCYSSLGGWWTHAQASSLSQ